MFSRRALSFILIAGIGTVLLAGCATRNPYTDQKEMSHSGKGALIGAAAGAVLGILTGSSNRAKRALIGAGVGALTGAGAGYYMDRQEAALQSELRGTGVRVVRRGNKITLVMPGDITFRLNSSELRTRFYPAINSVVRVVKHYRKTVLVITGYTDSTGSVAYNQLLSEQRAQSVANYLIRKGINPSRLVIKGFGEQYPIAGNATPAGRARNRRVELTLEPLIQPEN